MMSAINERIQLKHKLRAFFVPHMAFDDMKEMRKNGDYVPIYSKELEEFYRGYDYFLQSRKQSI